MTFQKALCLFLLSAVTLAGAGDIPRAAPVLEGKTIDGKAIALSQLKGKVVGVFFFSTDCPHCQHTTETVLVPAYAEMQSKGLEILGMAVNPSAATNLQAFAERFSAAFPMALSKTADMYRFVGESMMRRLGVPHLVLVDRQGQIRADYPSSDRAFWQSQEASIPKAFEALLSN